MRKDPLHQTVLHGTRFMARAEHSHQSGVIIEARIVQLLKEAGIAAAAVYAVASAGGLIHARVALARSAQGRARDAITTLLAVPFVRHVHVVVEEAHVLPE